MASWNEVKSLLAERFNIADDQGELVSLVFDEGDGRSQVVLIGLGNNENTGEQWVQVSSPIGKVGEVDLSAAAAGAFSLLCGGIVIIGEFVYLHHAAPMSNLDVNELIRPMSVVTYGADQLEKQLTGKDEY